MIPDAVATLAMRCLLEANFQMSREYPTMLSIDPATAEVVLEFSEGDASVRFLTTDLTAEYVRLNADYHT